MCVMSGVQRSSGKACGRRMEISGSHPGENPGLQGRGQWLGPRFTGHPAAAAETRGSAGSEVSAPESKEHGCVCRRKKRQVEMVRDAPGLTLPGNIRVEDVVQAGPFWQFLSLENVQNVPEEVQGPVLSDAGPVRVFPGHCGRGAEGGVMWGGHAT